ncbi:hypothetical protein BpHYR1_050411 [Brachionus plicatilis]|uniref:Uncharacterized protein n=1 Tax=Brachionus plicatilis TaxID=10195 RepID=A0A3M7RLF6_BRAPC|nr:hypothetical protein BpHYR1_050411 [Brachionus plicatilis]
MEPNGTWKMTQIENKSQTLQISDTFELVKEESTWQLSSNNEPIFNFGTDDMNKIQVAYPNYIAYIKDSDKSVYIVPFEGQKSIGNEYCLARADYVLSGGNQLI